MADFHVFAGTATPADTRPAVRTIEIGDIYDVLVRGIDDFRRKPSHVIFIAVIYPLVGVVLARWSSGASAPQLIFPLMAGFALIGPFASLGLYEISRRFERGLDPTWRDALEVRRSPAMPGIAVLGVGLILFLLLWLATADAVYRWAFDGAQTAGFLAFLGEVLTTSHGWWMMIAGNAIGFVFAAVVLSLTVVAFPMMLDRDCGVVTAIETSWKVTTTNPGAVAVWGLVVAVGLLLGSLPLFAGLAVVLPILGHATWHLYRATVVPDGRAADPS